jgi:hypothetical protein
MFSYKITSTPDAEQTINDMSFKGGIPNIPQRFEIPHCTLCGAEMTFFFQITFPKAHVWEGRVIVFFYCTSCYDVDKSWPQIIYVREQINISDNFLDTYQTNFQIWVFDANGPMALRLDFARRIKFERLEFEKINPKAKYGRLTKVGGTPAWNVNITTNKEDNELYKEVTYMSGGVDFLMQIERDWPFTRLPDAPLQMILPNYFSNETLPYMLFNGSPLKLLGTTANQIKPPRVLLYLLQNSLSIHAKPFLCRRIRYTIF